MRMNKIIPRVIFAISIIFAVFSCTKEEPKWKPNTDWGHWILGHRSNFDFLEKNNMTITFGSGAPNFPYVTRANFDSLMGEAKKFNQTYHDKGYIVLRYLSTSLNGDSKSNNDTPQKEQIHLLKFYNEQWIDFEDYIGPKPTEDPTTWMMVHTDGSFPYYRYAPYGQETDSGFEAWGVPVNPGYVRFMEGKIRAQAETGIDGSYIDWTHIASNTSYDKYSRQGFKEYLQKNLPLEVAKTKYGIEGYDSIELPKSRNEKLWMEWIIYRGSMVAEFHKHMRETARKYNPHFMISGNVFGGFGYGPIAYDGAGNMEMLAREGYDDFIYSEMQEYLDAAPRNKDGVKITNSPALKFLAAAAHGKPVIVYATEITPPIYPNPTEKCLSAMAQINIAEAVANHCIFREKRETPSGATAIYEFLAKNRAHLIGSHLSGDIAILASLTQYLADEQSFAFTTSRLMTDKGINHTFIVEDDLLQSGIYDYDLIILPYLPLMSIEKQQKLISYVKRGGQLILLGKTGSRSEFDVPNETIPLLTITGLKEYPELKLVKEYEKGKVTYLPLTIPKHQFIVKKSKKEGGTTFGPSMTDIFADLPDAYTRNNIHPELRLILENLVSEVESSQKNVTRLVSDLPFVELTTMRKADEHLLIHLVNYNVTIDGDISATQNIITQIRVPDGLNVKRITYSGEFGEMKELDFSIKSEGDNKTAEVIFPGLNIYGLARLEFK